MIETICKAVLLLPCAQTPAPKDKPDTSTKATLIVKGKDYFIHAIGGPTIKASNLGVSSHGDISIVHTTVATGEMKVLVRGESAMYRLLMAYERISVSQVSVEDYAADKERLYVLKFDTGPPWTYTLLVFRPADGALVHSLPLKTPEKRAEGDAKLHLRENGVEVFDTRFEFKGTELIKPLSKDKK
jgi:hypothetical protein